MNYITMAIIPINLDDELISKVDLLVKKGLYKNRSEALRDQIKKGIDKIQLIQEPSIDSELYQTLIKRLLARSQPPQFLEGEKTLTDLVSDGREE
ncbi:MAG: ribbon-helix-helix domain-containing protein [Candidatus Hodarchaeales archaeon]